MILARLARWFFNKTHTLWSLKDIDGFFAPLQHWLDLPAKLKMYRFEWKGEMSLLDWQKNIQEAMSDTQINCNDFATIFQYYLKKYYGKCKVIYQIDMENDALFGRLNPNYSWHTVTLFEDYGILYVQSNLDIITLKTGNEIEALVKMKNLFPKYTSFVKKDV